ncbi:MAG: FecR domain-containing protein, partial [Bacteroidia bacterium]|nr:FecR domain-containing protein [Bacteroidia bacterium]
LDGEAFFIAEKGQTFTVLTSQGTVEVLGTQFNVKERPDYFEVECYEGRVAVYYNNNEIELSPGQSIRLVNGIEQDRIEFNTNTPSWLNEESSFVEVGLNQVLDELERQYDIELETSTIEIDRIFTGSFTHTNLETALKSITIPLGLRYQVNGKNVTLFANDEH